MQSAIAPFHRLGGTAPVPAVLSQTHQGLLDECKRGSKGLGKAQLSCAPSELRSGARCSYTPRVRASRDSTAAREGTFADFELAGVDGGVTRAHLQKIGSNRTALQILHLLQHCTSKRQSHALTTGRANAVLHKLVLSKVALYCDEELCGKCMWRLCQRLSRSRR